MSDLGQQPTYFVLFLTTAYRSLGALADPLVPVRANAPRRYAVSGQRGLWQAVRVSKNARSGSHIDPMDGG